jgi:hypothetical protein
MAAATRCTAGPQGHSQQRHHKEQILHHHEISFLLKFKY